MIKDYQVFVQCNVTYKGTVLLRARDEEEAEKLALALVNHDDDFWADTMEADYEYVEDAWVVDTDEL